MEPEYHNHNSLFWSIEPNSQAVIDLLWVELSESCNHKCIHCYANSSNSELITNISNISLKSLLLEARYINIRNVKFVGGEPLLFKSKLKELLHFSRSLGFDNVAVHTNGMLLDDGWAQFLNSNNVHTDLTVYGHKAELHDSITRTRGAFCCILQSLEHLRKYRCSANLHLIVLPENESFLPQIQEFFKLSFPQFPLGYDYVRPVGRGLKLYRKLSFTWLNRYSYLENVFPGVDRNTFMFRHKFNPCLGNKIAIGANGSVFSCIMMREPLGYYRGECLSSVVQSDAFRRFRELPLSSLTVCCDCEFRYACDDCRPLAINISGSHLAKPPECRYDPYTGKVIDKKDWIRAMHTNIHHTNIPLKEIDYGQYRGKDRSF